jgi:hypothetical protein
LFGSISKTASERAPIEHGIGCRSTGAACTDLYHRGQVRIGKLSLETLGKAPPVGVVAHASAAAQYDGIDRTQLAGILRDLGEQGQDFLFARIGDVEAAESLRLRLGDKHLEVIGPELAFIEIDEVVAIVDALGLALAHMHGRCQRALNAEPDQSGAQDVARLRHVTSHYRGRGIRRTSGLPT